MKKVDLVKGLKQGKKKEKGKKSTGLKELAEEDTTQVMIKYFKQVNQENKRLKSAAQRRVIKHRGQVTQRRGSQVKLTEPSPRLMNY